MKQIKFSVCLILLIFILNDAFATIKLPYFFADNMVLQQQTNAKIWGWANANSTIKIVTSWDKKKYKIKSDTNGKWLATLTTPKAGGPYDISLSEQNNITIKNILIGEVWLCSGQSNMEMPLKGFKDQPVLGSNDAIFNADNDNIRLFTVPRSVKIAPLDTCKNTIWKFCNAENVSNFSATAYYFARIMQQKLNVPIGLVNISYGGSPAEAFMSEQALKEFPEIKTPKASDTVKLTNKMATTLYNGMLHSFVGFTFKGCIWYQGETNYDKPDLYEKLFPAMVKSWRSEFELGDFPFYYAQIAPYNYGLLDTTKNEKLNSAYLRDAQRKSLNKIPNCGMVVLLDIGEEKSIHPMNKEIGGKRFAYMALAKTYGMKGFASASPIFDSAIVKGNDIIVKFNNAPNGLTSFGKPITLFEIASSDMKFVPANAIIKGGNIIVNSKDITSPKYVRYAFRDYVNAEIFSTEGFPISSFLSE
jgi:sialate O-acetylesterase